MSYATLNDILVARANVTLPRVGNWTADVWLDRPEPLDGAVTFTLGDLELRGSIVRGGEWQGAGAYRIEGGAGGWRREIPAKWYSTGAVRRSVVLKDAARECGETVALDAHAVVGPAYVRPVGAASRVLHELVE